MLKYNDTSKDKKYDIRFSNANYVDSYTYDY